MATWHPANLFRTFGMIWSTPQTRVMNPMLPSEKRTGFDKGDDSVVATCNDVQMAAAILGVLPVLVVTGR